MVGITKLKTNPIARKTKHVMEKYFKRLKAGATAKMANKMKSARSSGRAESQSFRLVVFIIACLVLSTYIVVSRPQIDPLLTSKFFFIIGRLFVL